MAVVKKDIIKNFYGIRIGELRTDDRGNITALDRYGRIIGNYFKSLDITTEFPSGRILTKGDTTVALIWQKENERAERNKSKNKK